VTKLASLIFQVLVGQKKKASFPCCKTRATRVKRVEKFYLFPVFQESLVGAKMVARWGDLFLDFSHLIEDNIEGQTVPNIDYLHISSPIPTLQWKVHVHATRNMTCFLRQKPPLMNGLHYQRGGLILQN
jgi:hypothetical protein